MIRRGIPFQLALGPALRLVILALLVSASPASGQGSSKRHWTKLEDPAALAWMDMTAISVDDGRVIGWYKTRPTGEHTTTIVKYAVDCAAFRLSIIRSTSYNASGRVVDAHSAPTKFFPPPPVQSLQEFMRRLCAHPH